MCNSCDNPLHVDFEIATEIFNNRICELDRLISVVDKLSKRDQSFAVDLVTQFKNTNSLSIKQWEWVTKLADRVEGGEPIYGDFKKILVAFLIAGEHLKRPKIRLVSEEGRFVQLTFFQDTEAQTEIAVHVDGWQGHGYRKYAGRIEGNMIKPWSRDRMTDDVKNVIQELALDPMGVAKAMAAKLGVCMFCAQRLSTEESKSRGYGPICASHYGLDWG